MEIKKINIPWVESPFFEELLENKVALSDEEKEKIRFYNKNGYLILKKAIDFKKTDETRGQLEKLLGSRFSIESPRVMNLWEQNKNIKEIALNKEIEKLLKILYDREPIPFQTLNFSHGSRQKPHSDTIHFNSFPERYMCAAWVALEDMDEENGTVMYYPGSHKLNIYGYQHLTQQFNTSKALKESFYVDQYEPFIEQLMKSHNIKPEPLIIKKGDVLIWSANLIHGGLPIKDMNRTRWSQVTHYYFKDCLYYTPQLSNPNSGEWFLRKIHNIKTGENTWGSYNGYVPKRKSVPEFKYLISKYAPYNWRDLLFIFTRVYYRLFK